MKKLSLGAVLLCAAMFAPGLSSTAHAKMIMSGDIQNPTPVDPGCQDVPIDADHPCYAGTVSKNYYDGCTKAKTQEQCFSYCACGYNKNIQKKGCNVECKSVARSELNACNGACLTDY